MLVDPFARQIEYLRVSVTDRCDLRCDYCLPKRFDGFQEPEEWLSYAELARVVGAFGRLGTSRIRLTGGEPLTRRDLPALVERLAALPGIEDLSLSTNAVRLGKFATALKAAGLARVNISLDSLRADRFAAITGGGKLAKVLDGIAAAHAAGLTPVKVNMVVMGGVNDDEVEDVLEFCAASGYTLRLIETMPMGDTGRAASGRYVDLQTVKARLAQRYDLIPDIMPGGGPARYYRLGGTATRVGLITPISQHFCATCNRVRLTADGTLHLCLGQENSYAFRPLLRAGCTDAELEDAIRHAITLKPERHEFRERPEKVIRFMSMTGG